MGPSAAAKTPTCWGARTASSVATASSRTIGPAVGGSRNGRVEVVGLEDRVPDQLIRRLLVDEQVSRRVPHSYRIVLRFFPLR